MMRTIFEGWKRYGQDSDARVRARFGAEASKLREGYGAALWAMERYLRDSNAPISARGARPCVDLLTVTEILSELRDYAIRYVVEP